ncbi:MAG: hypothetical protein RLZZ292_312 [Bacteroidota bacterium]
MFFRFLFLLCLPMLGNAQFQKNCWMLGGDASLTRNFVPANTFASHNAFNSTELKLNTSIGYFINSRTVAGVGLWLNRGKLEYKKPFTQDNSKYGSWTISPFLRRYWGRDGGKFQYFAQAEVVLENPKWKNLSDMSFAGSVGADYFLTKNLALEGAIRVDDQLRTSFNGGVKLFLNTPKEENRQIVADSFLRKGNKIITGGITTKNYFGTNQTVITLGGKYFVKDNTALYVNFERNLSAYSFASNKIGIEHYFPVTPNTQLYVGGGLMYSRSQFLAAAVLEKAKQSFGAQTFVGVNKFIAPNLAIFGQANLDITRNVWTSKNAIKTSFQTGIRYYFK